MSIRRMAATVLSVLTAAPLAAAQQPSMSQPDASIEQSPPAKPAVRDGFQGFQFSSPDGNFQLRLRGLVHSDARFFPGDDEQLAADMFTMRRVRPMVEATVYRIFDLRLTPDFGGGTTVLQDAYLDLRFAPSFRIRGGKFKSPFGLERLASAGEMLFLERAFPTSVAPNRDVGMMVHGEPLGGDFSYAVALVDGAIDGGGTDGDDADDKDVVGRLFVQPFRRGTRERLKGLGVGAAVSYGEQFGSVATAALPTYRTTGQQVFFRYRADGTPAGTTIADGTRSRWSTQGYYYSGRLGILAEQVFSSQEVRRGTVAARLGTHSWQFAGSWVVTGEHASYRGVTPRQPFDRAAGTWGAFELTARYHQLTPDADAFPVFANPPTAAAEAKALSAGLNWFLNRNVKVVFQYEETQFEGGTPGGDRPAERGVFTRMQFAF